MTDQRQPVVLIGGFSEMLELCRDARCEVVGIIDPQPPSDPTLPYWGDEQMAADALKAEAETPLVVSPDAGVARRRLVDHYRALGRRFWTLIHPTAHVSPSADVGEGAVIQHGVYVSANCRVGRFARLNVGAALMHDVVVGSFATVAPRAVLLGRASTGAGCYIGANATILPECLIGEEAIVGAGAVVTKDVPDHKTAVGVPAQWA